MIRISCHLQGNPVADGWFDLIWSALLVQLIAQRNAAFASNQVRNLSRPHCRPQRQNMFQTRNSLTAMNTVQLTLAYSYPFCPPHPVCSQCVFITLFLKTILNTIFALPAQFD
jgi:hypothetical protein